jgi:hypothetical protein
MKFYGFIILLVTNSFGSPVFGQSQNQQPNSSQKKRLITKKLFDSIECHDDIVKYCPSKNDQISDLAVLKCMYDQVRDLSLVDKECHHVNKNYLKNIIKLLKTHFQFILFFFSAALQL